MVTDKQKAEFDDTEKGYYAEAVKLAIDVKQFFPDVDIERRERLHFDILLTVSGIVYRVSKDFYGHIQLFRAEYINYPGVSSHARGETYKLDITQNMKVMTKKKILAKIDAEEAYHSKMQELTDYHTDKVAEFMASVSDIKFDYQSEDKQRGSVTRNGITLRYWIETYDGHIEKKLSVAGSHQDDYIDAFRKLSDNKYK